MATDIHNENKADLWQKLRMGIMPVKEKDSAAVRLGKNMSFYIVVVLLGVMTVAIVLAITVVL
jgi:hypothetical protein